MSERRPIFDVQAWQWGRDLPRWQQAVLATLLIIVPPLFGYMVGRMAKFDQLGPILFALVMVVLGAVTLAVSIVGKELKRKGEMQRDQLAARAIQQHFNPAELPKVEGFDFSGSCRTFHEIGGDYYDVFRMDADRIVVTIADVSGKGTAAALVMASVHAILQTQVDAQRDLQSMASRLNTYLCRHTSQERFVTMVLGILRLTTREFEYINAGHNAPVMLLPDGTCRTLASRGVPLGLLPQLQFEVEQVTLAPGASLVLYTDGLCDRENAEGEDFGEKRILEAARSAPAGSTAQEVLTTVTKANNAFAQKRPHDDDSTILVVCSKAAGLPASAGATA